MVIGDEDEIKSIQRSGLVLAHFGDGHHPDYFELVNNVKENNNMATVNDVMNLELDADTQLLRQESIENNTGALTTTGQEVLLRTLYLANRKAVVAKVKEIVAARKAGAVTDDEDEE